MKITELKEKRETLYTEYQDVWFAPKSAARLDALMKLEAKIAKIEDKIELLERV